MATRKANINSLWAFLITEELIRNDIRQFYISPGSRSTPLTVAAASSPHAQTTIVYDERGAAYQALGYARASRKPAVLICTSGTAVANYLPAVVEAALESIPMIILSADRPPELRGSGANQTINQVNIFGEYTRGFFDLSAPSAEIPPALAHSVIGDLLAKALRSPAGPVHLNCMFREPLAPAEQKIPENYRHYLENYENSDSRARAVYPAVEFPARETVAEITQLLAANGDGLIIAGALKNEAERQAVIAAGNYFGWPVFADITSGLRFAPGENTVIHYFDQLLLNQPIREKLDFKTILQVGGHFVSKRLQQFLEEKQIPVHIQISDAWTRNDPGHNVRHRLTGDLSATLPLFRAPSLSGIGSGLLPKLNKWDARIAALLDQKLSGDELHESSVARELPRLIPDGHGLFLSSSMPVRDADMYAAASGNSVVVSANRGASGIDGIISSALGFANGLQKPVTVLIGDLAMLHDLNALTAVSESAFPVTIVVINNHGGGIFHWLPIAGHQDVFEKYFATPHEFGFEHAAKMFRLPYFQPQSLSRFAEVYQVLAGKSGIIEIITNRENEREQHRQLQEFLATEILKEQD
jgi:2-succinyl-5-enolpyruvyl-6-hydroxy-3-cyclohexene-1-carboxylate synthase